MIPVLAALGMSFILPFAFLTDNSNCNGLEARWDVVPTDDPIPYQVNLTAQPFAGTLDRVQAGMDAFGDINSSYFSWSYQAGTPPRGFVDDIGEINAISFGDANGNLGAGVLAATVSFRGAATHGYDAQTWRSITQMDIVFNDGVTFGPNSALGTGCTSTFSIEAVLIHEAGHGLGLQHPDQCISPNDPEGVFEPYQDAVMYSSIAPCDDGKFGFKLDDAQGITYLYDNGQPLIYPGYTTSVDRGYAPLIVQFLDQSIGANTWNWNFGDGQSSTSQNISHTYNNPGTYTANLTVNGAFAANATEITAVVAPIVDFNADVTGGEPPLDVNFVDATQGNIFGWNWEFGDGITSNQQHPSHQYTQEGVYTVTLTVTGTEGPIGAVRTDYITVENGFDPDDPDDEKKGPFAQFFEDLGCQCSFSGPRQRPLGGLYFVAAVAALAFVRRRRTA